MPLGLKGSHAPNRTRPCPASSLQPSLHPGKPADQPPLCHGLGPGHTPQPAVKLPDPAPLFTLLGSSLEINSSTPLLAEEPQYAIVLVGQDGRTQDVVGNQWAARQIFRVVQKNGYATCLMNRHCFEAVAGCQLSLRAGSLGLCIPEPVWYEWGGDGVQCHTALDTFTSSPATGTGSLHFWFEDAAGRVYDVLDEYVVSDVAPLHKKIVYTGSFPLERLIFGKTVVELRRCGLQYVPAPDWITRLLVQKYEREIVYGKASL